MSTNPFVPVEVAEADKRNERAMRAVKAFRQMQPMLTGYARALTGKKNVAVELATGAPRTDGTKIYFRPPIELGDEPRHRRSLCDKRDPETLIQLCGACAVREEVMVNILHEISHIAFGTFEKPKPKHVRAAMDRAIEEAPGAYADRIRKMWDSIPEYKKQDYLNLSGLISPFLPILVNSLEDARVDESMHRARRGTRIMFEASLKKAFSEGVQRDDGTVWTWAEQPLNSQAIIGVFVLSCGYNSEGWFSPEVETALNDERLRLLCSQVDTIRSSEGTYNLAFPILARLRELGFCRSEVDPEVPEEEPDTQENEDEQEEEQAPSDDQGDPGDRGGEDGSESDQSLSDDGDEPEGSSEDGEPSADGKSGEGEDQGDGEGTSPHEDDSGLDDSDSDPEEADADSRVSDEGGDSSGADQASSEDADASGSDSGSSQGGPEEGDGEPGEAGGLGDPGDGGDDEGAEGSVPTGGIDWSDEGSGRWDGSSVQDEADQSGAEGDVSDSALGDGSDPGLEPGDSGTPAESAADGSTEGSDVLADDVHGQADTDLREGDGAREASHDVRDSESGVEDDGTDSVPEGDEGDESVQQPDGRLTDEESGWDPNEVVDTGADEGMGGDKLDTNPKYGDAERAFNDIQVFSKHDLIHAPLEQSPEEEADDKAIDMAIMQGGYFETPSKNVAGVREHRFADREHDKHNDGWANYDNPSYSRHRVALGGEADLSIGEEYLGPALIQMRRAFTDNKRSAQERNRRSGKINTKVLGKRAPFGDDRLFQKKRIPGKKSYAVIIGLDISGSTIGENIVLIKRAGMAQAELCERMGIDFAVYAHSGTGGWDGEDLMLDIYQIKSFDEPWDPNTQEALQKLCSDSQNLDGHTLEFYRKTIDRHPATDKIILYYTDGKMPAENYDEELEILEREIRVCRQKGIALRGVGIRTDSPTRHGLPTTQVDNDEDLVKVIRDLQSDLLRHR